MANAAEHAILWPMVGQVGLVALVWLRMYRTRLGEMRSRKISPQAVKTSRLAATALEDVAAADNFRNLFEVPVLFFAVCLALAVGADWPIQVLAWPSSACARSQPGSTSRQPRRAPVLRCMPRARCAYSRCGSCLP
jgi:hypothetical protein